MYLIEQSIYIADIVSVLGISCYHLDLSGLCSRLRTLEQLIHQLAIMRIEALQHRAEYAPCPAELISDSDHTVMCHRPCNIVFCFEGVLQGEEIAVPDFFLDNCQQSTPLCEQYVRT